MKKNVMRGLRVEIGRMGIKRSKNEIDGDIDKIIVVGRSKILRE